MRFLLGPAAIHKIEWVALESASSAANARLRYAAVRVNGLRAAAATFENQRPGNRLGTDKSFVRNTLLISALNRILCVESRKVLSSKDLRLPVNRVL
jgi:hypothetical protein